MSVVCTSTNKTIFEELFRGKRRELAPHVVDVVASLEDYWPLSVRQIFYQCVAKLIVPNEFAQYRRVQGILKKLREEGVLPWACIEDRTRTTTAKRGVENITVFLRENLESMLNWRYYHRCHVQGQSNYVELSIEKQALSPLVEEIGWKYCTRVNTTRGRPSVTMVEQIASRFDKAMQRGQKPILLHFGDLDPTGVAIPKALKKNFFLVHGLEVDVRMGGLTPKQCMDFKLPESMDPANEQDPNINAWYAEYEDQSPTELDALHPSELQAVVEAELLGLYDTSLMNKQRGKEHIEEDLLKGMRRETLRFLRGRFPDQMRQL